MKERIKQYLKGHPLIYGALITVRAFVQSPDQDPLKTELKRLLGTRQAVFFIQIGSNDGLQGDPIHELIIKNKDWTGIFIEPVKCVFDRLRCNYENSTRFVFENVAIGTERETREFYYISDEAKKLFKGDLPFWYDQLGSFDKQHILKHLDGALEPYIVTERIECVLLDDILSRNSVGRIDLLHIDTEGFDYKVLCQIDFDNYAPSIILYENRHLSIDERQSAETLLIAHGYRLTRYDGDTMAVFTGS